MDPLMKTPRLERLTPVLVVEAAGCAASYSATMAPTGRRWLAC